MPNQKNENYINYFNIIGDVNDDVNQNDTNVEDDLASFVVAEEEQGHKLEFTRQESISSVFRDMDSNLYDESNIDFRNADLYLDQIDDVYGKEDIYRSVGCLTPNHYVQDAWREITPDFPTDNLMPHSSKNDKENSNYHVKFMTRSISKGNYKPTLIHAFSNVSSSNIVIENIKKVLDENSILFNTFDTFNSSFSCKINTIRFDIYVLEVLPQDRASGYGRFLIEIQRLTSAGCFLEWNKFLNKIMKPLQKICVDEFGCFKNIKEQVVSSSNFEKHDNFTPIDLLESESDDELKEIPKDALKKEYLNIVKILCDKSTCHENKVQLSKLLATISNKADGAKILLNIEALDMIVNLLQREVTLNTISSSPSSSWDNDLNCMLCKILTDIVSLEDPKVSENEDLALQGSAITLKVLRDGSNEKMELQQLREAAKALTAFSKVSHNPNLKPMIYDTISQRCAQSNCISDELLVSHMTNILELQKLY